MPVETSGVHEGERVLWVNPQRVMWSAWNSVLATDLCRYPATHVLRIETPYPMGEDRTMIERDLFADINRYRQKKRA